MIQPLSGLGIWIWELAHCERGDLGAIIARCAACGVKWLAIKSGDSRSNGQMTRARLDELRDGGLQVAAWWYSVPGTADLQLEQLRALTQMGVTHFIQDAEIEWERGIDHRPGAGALAARIRAVIGADAYFADAPWPIRRAHPTFPFDQFGAIAQARMPQAYYAVAELDGGRPPRKYLDEGDAAWASSKVPVCPIVSPVNANGSKHSAVSELAAALDRYVSRPAVSIWSWQHLLPVEWDLLRMRARAAAPIDVTDGGNNKPVFVAPDPLDDKTDPDPENNA